jgi:hypothetical protein
MGEKVMVETTKMKSVQSFVESLNARNLHFPISNKLKTGHVFSFLGDVILTGNFPIFLTSLHEKAATQVKKVAFSSQASLADPPPPPLQSNPRREQTPPACFCTSLNNTS